MRYLFSKSEIRIPKSETNSKSESPKLKTRTSVFEFWPFEFVSDFEIRISDFSLAADLPRRLVEHPVAHDAEERLKGVLEADLLAFLVRAAGVGDGDFVDAPGRPALGDLRRELRLEPESVGLQRDALQHLAAAHLVAGRHVREVQVREHVRERRQSLVGDVVPEVQDAMAFADEARAEDDVGPVLDDRLQQPRILGGIILKIGVLHEDNVA